MDFLFRVLFRSSRKLGWTAKLLLGEVGGICELKEDIGICCGGGERASGSGGPLLRRCIVGGGAFFKELCFHEDVLEGS